MIEHPVPQNVAAYQFRLVGDMTLKQFLELVVGLAISWFIWTLKLPLPFRLPLVALFAFAGFAMAFIPIEERSLDQWFMAFIKTVYSPTLFKWKKSFRSDILDFIPRKSTDTKPIGTVVKTPTSGLKTLLEAYSLQNHHDIKSDELEKDWLERQNMLQSLFEKVQIPPKLAAETTFPKKLPPPAARHQTLDTSYHLHPLLPPDNPSAILRGEITLSPRIPKIPPPPIISAAVSVPSPKPTTSNQQSAITSLPSIQPKQSATSNQQSATSNFSLPLPSFPDQPNILAGMVLDSNGQIVPAAIIEIRDKSGLPVRAIKTNGLGQFAIATPLRPGTYELEVEKPDLTFDILKLEVKNEIIPPIEIRAKGDLKN